MTDEAPKLDPEKVKLGITPTLWWNDDFPLMDAGITFGQCVSEMALAGFEGCSTGHKFPTDPEVIKAELGMRGLQVSEPWVSTFFTISEMERQTVETFHQQMAFIQACGGSDIVVAELGRSSHPLPVAVYANKAVFDDAQWEALSSGLNKLGEIANGEGMRLCYHHHIGTGVMTRAELDRLMENTDPALVHLLFDTGHMAFAGD